LGTSIGPVDALESAGSRLGRMIASPAVVARGVRQVGGSGVVRKFDHRSALRKVGEESSHHGRQEDQMSSGTHMAATIDDLYRVKGKAELIGGRIVHIMPDGRRPGRVAGRISRSLDDYAETTDRGETYAGSIGFAVPTLSSGRESFSPDASYHVGPFPSDEMRFIDGPPTFAVEVRSEGDYGPAAEAEMAAKRADYFEAGTAVVWDVDPIAKLVRKYRREISDQPEVFAVGQEADAEPAVPGWRLAVGRIFT
jgi:Uma2 family endonuclease